METKMAVMYSLNLYALATNVILLFASWLGLKHQPLSRSFFRVVLFSILNMTCEVIVDGLMGVPGATRLFWCKVFDFLSYALIGPWFASFGVYFYEYLQHKTPIARKFYRFMVFCGVATVILALISSFTGLYSTFDANNEYVQQPYFWVSQVCPLLSFLACIIVTLKHRATLSPRVWVPILLYPVAPLICYIIEIVYVDIWISHVGVALTQFLVYTALHVDLQNEISKQALELQEAQTAVMISQIQPHFLYNALGSIQDLCRRDPERAENSVREFSRYLRNNLDSKSYKEPIAFERELEHVKTYLSLEENRFEERLKVVYDINAVDFAIPALTLQALVENAVRHGITERVEGGTIKVSSYEEDGCFKIIVEDDGVGFSKETQLSSERTHIGISSTERRLSLYGGSLEIDSTPNIGTKAVITIPKKGA